MSIQILNIAQSDFSDDSYDYTSVFNNHTYDDYVSNELEDMVMDIVNDYRIDIFCLDEEEYSSNEFLSYLEEYMADFLYYQNKLIIDEQYPKIELPDHISFEIYEKVAEMLFDLSEPEYISYQTKIEVYKFLWNSVL